MGLHQGVEYVLAIALAVTAIHISGRSELVMAVGAVVLVLLAALTKGPLSAFRVVAPRPHRVLEVVVGAVLVLLPLVDFRHPSLVAIGLLELSGLVLLRLAYVGIRPPRPPREPRHGPLRPVSRVISVRPRPLSVTPLLDAGARAAGRATGRAQRKAAGVAPVAGEALGRGARRLGAAVGRHSARKSPL